MYAAAARDALPGLASPNPGLAPRIAAFSPLEVRVLELVASGSERPSTSVEPRLRRLGRRLSGILLAHRDGQGLADPRLEALRSYAAGVRRGRADGLAVFHAAGYSAAQAQAVRAFVADGPRLSRHEAERRSQAAYAGGLSLGLAAIAGFIALTGTLLAGA